MAPRLAPPERTNARGDGPLMSRGRHETGVSYPTPARAPGRADGLRSGRGPRGLGERRANRGGGGGDLGREPVEQVAPARVARDRLANPGHPLLKLARVGEREAGPEPQLLALRGQPDGGAVALPRLGVAAPAGELVPLGRHRVGLVEAQESP